MGLCVVLCVGGFSNSQLKRIKINIKCNIEFPYTLLAKLSPTIVQCRELRMNVIGDAEVTTQTSQPSSIDYAEDNPKSYQPRNKNTTAILLLCSIQLTHDD
ncbi:hypothetical protein VNO77_00081 [Canavalia gladiata]|uniref:Uncharacterized protein n=1 Tax=Canavalia gladiata TaxID=3824 RepID=A0AAN9R8X7_CANGL